MFGSTGPVRNPIEAVYQNFPHTALPHCAWRTARKCMTQSRVNTVPASTCTMRKPHGTGALLWSLCRALTPYFSATTPTTVASSPRSFRKLQRSSPACVHSPLKQKRLIDKNFLPDVITSLPTSTGFVQNYEVIILEVGSTT